MREQPRQIDACPGRRCHQNGAGVRLQGFQMPRELLTAPMGDDPVHTLGHLLHVLERRGQDQYAAAFPTCRADHRCGIVIEGLLALTPRAKRHGSVTVGEHEGHGTEVHDVDPAILCMVQRFGSDETPE